MTTTFMSAPSLMLTTESVTEGHPDKLCDQISDAVLDAILARGPDARASPARRPPPPASSSSWARSPPAPTSTSRRSSATRSATSATPTRDYGFDCETCGVIVSIKEQSRRHRAWASTTRSRRKQGARRGRRCDIGRRRPGHDDRLRLQRDAGVHAADDRARAPPLPPARRGAQGRRRCPTCAPTASRRSRSSTTTASP